MKLHGRANMVINRFWNSYKSDELWFITSNTKEELEIFIAYWFKPISDGKKEDKEEKTNDVWTVDKGIEQYREEYKTKNWKDVPSNKKNDVEWIKSKL